MRQELQKDKEWSSHLPSLLMLREITLPHSFYVISDNSFQTCLCWWSYAACCREFIVSWCCEFNLPIMWKVWSRTHTWFFKALVCLAQWQCKRLHSCMVAEFTTQNIVIAHGKAFSAKAERIVSALWLQKMNWPSRGGRGHDIISNCAGTLKRLFSFSFRNF